VLVKIKKLRKFCVFSIVSPFIEFLFLSQLVQKNTLSLTSKFIKMKFQFAPIIIVFIFLFQTSFTSAQGRNGNQSHNSNGNTFAFKVENAIGVVRHDTKIVFKKVKIKKEATKQQVSKIISAFNHNVDKIKFVNSVLMNEVRLFIDVKKMEAKLNKNTDLMRSAKATAKQRLQPIRFLVVTESEKLDNQLEKILSKKQFKKWKRYLEKQKNRLKPKASERPRVNAAKAGAMRNNYNQRGQQRRRY